MGLYAEDASHVHLRHLNIHGLAHAGVWAGRLRDWTVEHVRIVGNGWVGWDGDIDGDDSNAGTLTFRHWTVAWNGCGETWPSEEPIGCWAQTAGGYGDGVGTGSTGGHWIIEDSAFLYNTSDGLDLLYVREPGSSITIRRTRAMGNAGNGIKTNGDLHMENAVIVGNCGFFAGKDFTYHVDHCRAAGNALSITLRPNTSAEVINSTITGHGDCLTELICEGNCHDSEALTLRNNIFIGHQEFLSPDDRSCFIYTENFPHDPVDVGYSIVYETKGDCPIGDHMMCQDPLVQHADENAFDGRLREGSPAIDAGLSHVAPPDDVTGALRDHQPDIGAYEFVNMVTPTGTPNPTHTPTSTPTPTPTVTPTPSPTPSDCDLPWDLNQDGIVDITDITIVIAHSIFTNAPYDPAFDFDHDGQVDIVDIFMIAHHFGETCPLS